MRANSLPQSSLRSIALRKMRANVGLAAVVAGLLLLAASAVPAQSPRDQRRDLVEGLLRTFLEAQMEKNLRPDRPPQPPPQIPAGLTKAREALTGFAREADQLYQSLLAATRTNAAARNHLPDMLRVRTQAMVLAEKSSRIYDLPALGREFQDLERQWRSLSYRLDQAEGLNRTAGPSLRRLDDLAAALCQLCGIQPQLDYRELLRKTETLGADLQRLVEEFDSGLGRTREAQAYQLQGRRVQLQARGLANLVAQQAPRDALVVEFEKYQRLWQPFAAGIWPLNNRLLELGLRRLEETDRQIHELLWLPVPINREQLQHVTGVLMSRVDELLDRVTLRLLLELRGAENVLNLSGEFHGVCENFAGVVQQRGAPAGLRQEYQFVIDAWPGFSACFRSAREPEILNLLKEIEQTFVSLRDALLIAPEFDRRLAVQRAALLAYAAENLAIAVRDTAGKDNRYPAAWRAQFVQACQAFGQTTQQFAEALGQRRPDSELASQVGNMVRSWVRLQREYLPRLDDGRRSALAEIEDEITPVVIDLQAMFEF